MGKEGLQEYMLKGLDYTALMTASATFAFGIYDRNLPQVLTGAALVAAAIEAGAQLDEVLARHQLEEDLAAFYASNTQADNSPDS